METDTDLAEVGNKAGGAAQAGTRDYIAKCWAI